MLASLPRWIRLAAAAMIFSVLLPFAARAGVSPYEYTINNNTVTITGFTGANSRIIVPNNIQGKHVVAFGPYAFGSGLAWIRIPATVTNIGEGAFAACPILNAVEISGGDPAYSSRVGVLMDKHQGTIIRYPPRKSGRTYQVPNTVTNLADFSFESCARLNGIYFSENAPALGSNVFLGDTGLTVYYVQGTSGWGSSFGGVPTATWKP